VPAVRFSRDKRGYEYVYLVHTPMRRGKAGRSKILYWYRTPPGIRVGRKPFDEVVQRTLEQQNPGVSFDWPAIISTPMPPPDMTEFWRERRRAEKAARQERRAMESDDASDPEEEVLGDAALQLDDSSRGEQELATVADSGEPGGTPMADALPATADAAAVAVDGQAPRKRRGRRGGRRRNSSAEGSAAAEPAAVDRTDTENMEPGGAGRELPEEQARGQSERGSAASEEE